MVKSAHPQERKIGLIDHERGLGIENDFVKGGIEAVRGELFVVVLLGVDMAEVLPLDRLCHEAPL